ncbi:MAG: type IV pilus assembly protein PilM [Sedimentisphaerales bacterium]|nr:type IV pilus assembly protein PilM [Sedimentisphaerales bacterium]
MVAKTGGVWSIDLGNNSLKALHLQIVGETVEVIGFENIQHSKILTGSSVTDRERDELTALTLRSFVSQNDLAGGELIISVPGQNSFARFVNLPPVESKRIPEIVQYEAAQQIPFDIDEVQWDWQLLTDSSTSEPQVGIFAIKNDVVDSALEPFSRENVNVTYVQMTPMALYNYLLYDRPELVKSDKQATVVLNIGADNIDLVVCSKSTVWQRSIAMGGNTFTRAIADTFKLNFEKAEKLKRTAAMSKYARQILQAMKPVFTDLASEIQRSLGFYSNSNPDTKLSRIIAFGGGTKMRGLIKYLQQSLQIPIEIPDSFKRLAISSAISTAKFHECVGDFGVVYGLGLQALGLGRIENNLLPVSIARSMAWAGKAKYFTAAAAMLVLVAGLSLGRTLLDKASYKNNERVRQQISRVISDARSSASKLESEKSKNSSYEAKIDKKFELFKYREVLPLLQQAILSVLPNEENNPEQVHLYRAFAQGDVDGIRQVPRKERKQIFLTNLSISFSTDIEYADFSEMLFLGGGSGRMREQKEEFSMIDDSAIFEMMGGQGKSKSKFSLRTNRPTQSRTRTDKDGQEATEQAGFIITIAGYSPYKDIGQLLDPAGVGNDPNQWGVVTRLLHLDEIFDPNEVPFKLYKKTDPEHFRLDKGVVDLQASEMPAGIGLTAEQAGVSVDGISQDITEEPLYDPMTKEIISKVPKLDEYGSKKVTRSGDVVYENNDHWFVLDIKFVWKNAPEVNLEN